MAPGGVDDTGGRLPRVSCIMPTRNRRRFVGQAILYFIRQDYPDKELVIVDDGEDSVGDLAPADDRVRYVRLERRLSLGEKRNLAIEVSSGELIAHWDDDDWFGADRLTRQVEMLRSTGAAVCGASRVLMYRPVTAEAWRYRPSGEEGQWLSGGTLLYARGVWNQRRFPPLDHGEDVAFLHQLPHHVVRSIEDPPYYVALLHGLNTSMPVVSNPLCTPRPLNEVTGLLADDRDFYVQLRHGWTGSSVSRPSAPSESVSVVASFDVTTGYGALGEYLVLGLAREGVRVDPVPLSITTTGLTDEFRRIFARSRPDPHAALIYFSWIQPSFERYAHARNLIVNTMWESDRLPRSWVTALNRSALAVVVPTRFCERTFLESGVAVPIHVVPEGIDPAVYAPIDRTRRSEFTTLIVAPMSDRKNTQHAVAAWKRAFGTDSRARLLIKNSYPGYDYVPDDPRIAYVSSYELTRGIAEWYARADVLLALGNEGFGLPAVEAMATGLPVIALDSEGQHDLCEDAAGLVLPVRPAGKVAYAWDGAPAGDRCVPNVDDVAAHLRWVADHRGEARELGRRAADWALRNRNVWDKGPAIAAILEDRVDPPRSLRRTDALWVSSLGTECGIAAYTDDLARALPSTRAIASIDAGPGLLRILHVQHHPSLFHDETLARTIREARRSGASVAVTEHEVVSQLSAWEYEADALVSTSDAGAELLRRKWPAKRVEHIPLGCPTWFPTRKTGRGHVLGAFGFLGPHKGFGNLLDVLRHLPGTELLLFSRPRSLESAFRWRKSIDGLPVRWIDDYLPTDEVARRLAAEADVLVFWYDDVPQHTTSAAVRVGLASGVPVLASPTIWFRDLQNVVYQPRDLIGGVERLLQDDQLRDQVVTAAHAYCHLHTWSRVADRHRALWRQIRATGDDPW